MMMKTAYTALLIAALCSDADAFAPPRTGGLDIGINRLPINTSLRRLGP